MVFSETHTSVKKHVLDHEMQHVEDSLTSVSSFTTKFSFLKKMIQVIENLPADFA